MIPAALLLALDTVLLVVAVHRFALPAFLALMAVAAAYGFAAELDPQPLSMSFGRGFGAALEQVGLLILAGTLVGALAVRAPFPAPAAAAVGLLGGLSGAATGTLALLQPAGDGAPRRALMLVLGLLAVQALLPPSPLALGAIAVLKADVSRTLWLNLPLALVVAAAGWLYVTRLVPADSTASAVGLGWLALLVPLALVIGHAVAQLPAAPFGRGAERELITGVSRPLMLALMAIVLAMLLSWRRQPAALAGTGWATLLLTVGAAGGLSQLLGETAAAELLAEQVLDPRLGLLAPFLATAAVKTMQGNSLTALLTGAGMVEPMLPALGLDSAIGRALAAAACGAGSIAICHINDPLFWIAAHMARLSPGRALLLVSGGSVVVALAALLLLSLIRLFV